MSTAAQGSSCVGPSITMANAIVLVCDIQDGKLLKLVEDEQAMRLSAALVCRAAGLLLLPVIVTEQVPAKLGHTHPGIKDALPEKFSKILEKKSFSMITPEVSTTICHYKKSKFGAILVGMETHVCILQTCLDLREQGMAVHVVVDAVSSQRSLDKEVALRQMENAGAILTTSESLIFKLLGGSDHSAFRQCSKLCVQTAKARNLLASATSTCATPAATTAASTAAGPVTTLRLNTSNKFKYAEFVRMFASASNGKITLDRTKVDLHEIDAAPYMVVAQKATDAGEGVIIEDTSLDVQGAEVGVNVRWIMDNLSDLAGRGATWRVLLGVLRGTTVHIFEGLTRGTIVHKRGASDFGFDPVFQPEGTTKTLAEAKPDGVSARFKAVTALVSNTPAALHVPVPGNKWKGKWQED